MLVAFNKPHGVLCQFTDRSTPPRPTLAGFGLPAGVYAAGRLDHDSEGLLLLTDDGQFLHYVSSPKRKVSKTYRATLSRPLNGDEASLFSSGTLILKGETKPLDPAVLRVVSPTEAYLTITEGRYGNPPRK